MKRCRGFTIVELAIVITVIAILLVIGTIGFNSMQAKSRDKEREANVNAIATYLENIYPDEIKDKQGNVIKSAGSYPALMALNKDGTTELESIFSNLDSTMMTAPGTDAKKIPGTTKGKGTYHPDTDETDSGSKGCDGNFACYQKPNDTEGSKDEYIYAPGPSDNELCVRQAGSDEGSENCRQFSIIYRTESGDNRVVVKSKRR